MTKARTEQKIPTPDEACAAVERLRNELAAATEDLTTRRATLEEIEGNIGDRLLDAKLAKDDKAAATINADLAAARLAVETSGKVVDALEKRIAQAQRDVLVADAHALRAETARLMEEVRPRLEKTSKLLDQLHEVEDVRVIPEPWVHPSGVVPSGSWKRTRTGEILFAIIDLERRAVALEARSGVSPRPSILEGVTDVPWHLGSEGIVEAGVPIKVGGSELDKAAAALMGKPLPVAEPTVQQIAATPRRNRGVFGG